MRLRREVHDRVRRAGSKTVDRPGDRLRVLDRATDEAKSRIVRNLAQVLLTPGIGQLVEHRHLIALLLHTQANEGRADEPSATTHKKPHRWIIPFRAAMYPARPSCQGGIGSTSSRSD